MGRWVIAKSRSGGWYGGIVGIVTAVLLLLSVDLLSSPGVESGQREAEGLRHLRLCRQELPGGGEGGRGWISLPEMSLHFDYFISLWLARTTAGTDN